MIKSKLYTMPLIARMIPNFFYVNPPRVLKLGTKKKTYQISPRASILKDLIYVVDKLHIQGHVGQKCLKIFHPKLFPEIAPLNTVVCEQCNFWLGKYKFMLKHMNQYRFLFFFIYYV